VVRILSERIFSVFSEWTHVNCYITCHAHTFQNAIKICQLPNNDILI